MFNLDSFENTEANDGGEWVDVPSYPDMRLKVRSENYKPYQTAFKSLVRRQGRRAQQAILSDEFASKQGELLAEHILLDWDKALRGNDGKEVKYSAKIAKTVLTATDPEGAGATFRDLVIGAANEVAARRLGLIEDAAGN